MSVFTVPRFSLFLISFLLVFCSISVFSASNVLHLANNVDQEVVSLTPYLEYMVDADDALTIDDLYNHQDNVLFKSVTSNSIPVIRQAVWYRVTLKNALSEDRSLVVNFDELLIDELTLYYQNNGNTIQLQAGLNYAIKDRPINYRFLAMPITLEANSEQTIYFRIKTSHIPLIAPTISSELEFSKSVAASTIVNLLFIGMGLGLCLFMAIFLPLAIASKESYCFIAYLILTTLVIISVSGFFQYLFPEKPEWHKFLLVALLAANSVSNLLMVNTFFEIHRCHPFLNKIYWFFGFGFSGFIWGYGFLGGFEALMVPLITCTLLMFILLLSTSVLKYYQGSPHAGLFIVAKLFFFFSCLYSALGAEGVLPYNALIRHGVGSGIILQAAIICLATAKKVSAEKAHAAELAKNVAIARAASRDKSEFLATMSHEIRTPMNGVLGMAQMLENSPLNPEQKRYTQVIMNSGKTLLAVINDILDFSKIEAGKMQLAYRPFDLQSMINDTHTLFMPIAKEKGLNFKFRIEEDCPTQLNGDPIRLQQILNNLLSNAFKFTEQGFVELTIQLNSSTSQGVELLFSVKDSGIGIGHHKQRQVFQAFTQAHRSTSRSYGGTGLGLAISKQLADLMHGQIGINSDENSGAEFWFTANFELLSEHRSQAEVMKNSMPDAALKAIAPGVEQTPYTKPILVAEDNQVNQQVIAAMLSHLGLGMVLAADGERALELYQANENSFSAVLMDLEMPVKNGYQAADAIRDLEKTSSETSPIPIIALTAHVLESNIQRCYESGMDAVLKKPLQLPELIDALAALGVHEYG
ncbi:MAG: ATP-binding protein [Cellvibrionales bacterium]|nr:ATP-binding protein [Cellvibrionales bacterium]